MIGMIKSLEYYGHKKQHIKKQPTKHLSSWSMDKKIPLHFRQHTLEIAEVLKLDIGEAKHDRIFQLEKLEEDRIIAIQHQESQK